MRRRESGRLPWLLILLCSAQFVLVVDMTIVVVALPSIARDLHFGQESLQWIITIYGLTFGGFLMLGGRGADMFGRREAFIAGMSVFLFASLACALSDSQMVLLGARAAQGLGAAVVSPAALSLLTATYHEGAARNRALGIWSAVAQGGSITGNVLGGVLSSTLGWRWIFLVNVPICAFAIGLALVVIAPSGRGSRQFIDVPGAVSVTFGLGLLMYAFGEVEQRGLAASETIATLLGACVCLAAFVVVERRVSNPLVPLSIMRGQLAVGNLLVILSGPVTMGAYLFMSLYEQDVLGFSALRAGVAFVPWAVAVGVTSVIVSRRIATFGLRKIITTGYLATGAGLVLMLRISTTHDYWSALLPAFIVVGIGGGISGISNTIVAMGGIRPGQQGLAAGILNSSQRVGSAIGVALLVTIATSRTNLLLGHHLSRAVATVSGYKAGLDVSIFFALLAGLVAWWLLASVEPDPALRGSTRIGPVQASTRVRWWSRPATSQATDAQPSAEP